MVKHSALKAKLYEEELTYKKMASKISISSVSLSHKLNGKIAFTEDEIREISDVLDIRNPEEICRMFHLTRSSK